jgi:hypothetical protein
MRIGPHHQFNSRIGKIKDQLGAACREIETLNEYYTRRNDRAELTPEMKEVITSLKRFSKGLSKMNEKLKLF